MIRFECPHCGKGLRTDDEMIGQAFNCPSCRGRVRVPDDGTPDQGRQASAGAAATRFQVQSYQPRSSITGRLIAQMLLWALAVGTLGVLAGILLAGAPLPRDLSAIVGGALGAVLGAAAACVLTGSRPCPRCHRARAPRSLGTMQRDEQSAKEALEAGDLAALRALTPEGEPIEVTVTTCRRCGKSAPVDVLFAAGGPTSNRRELAHVTYPGAALPVFEGLCRRQ